MTDAAIDTLARQLGAALLARRQTVATAESCTGGLIAGAITDIAGSSDWFGWGFVSYANAAKRQLLGVGEATLAAHGAVSAETVAEMAVGARRVSGADWAVAVSGVAGPSGGSPDKPVGLVWFGLVAPDGTVETFSCRFDGDRAAVRRQTVAAALRAVLDRLAAA